MNFQEALAEIESVEFDIQLNLASSFSLYMQIAREELAVMALYREVMQSEQAAKGVLRRVCELSKMPIDTKYLNPKDTAMAILLWLLSITHNVYAKKASYYVAFAPNCAYAWKIALPLLSPLPAPTPSATGDTQLRQSWFPQGHAPAARADRRGGQKGVTIWIDATSGRPATALGTTSASNALRLEMVA